MSTTFVTNVPFPPAAVPVANVSSGTITRVHSAGPIDATITDAAGNVLASYQWNPPMPTCVQPSQQVFDVPANLSFSGGVPVITQRSGSAITVTLA